MVACGKRCRWDPFILPAAIKGSALVIHNTYAIISSDRCNFLQNHIMVNQFIGQETAAEGSPYRPCRRMMQPLFAACGVIGNGGQGSEAMETGDKAEKKAAYGAIIERIRAMIVAGELVPGDRLPAERSLAERFGVSRGQLRQAFQALAERNIIESRQGDGTYLLTGLDADQSVDTIIAVLNDRSDVLREIIEFRQMIEPQIAALAAGRIDRATLDQLKILVCDQQRALVAGRAEDGRDADFHQLLAQSTRNRVISRVMTTIQAIINESRSSWLQSNSRRATSVEGHLRIIDALEAGDGAAAASAMQRHILDIEEYIFDDPNQQPNSEGNNHSA